MESIPPIKTSILVVDDEVDFLLSTKLTLLSVDMPEPALVSESTRVMELVREHRFLLILLDLAMPHVSGLEILRQVKEEFPDIECVVVTAIDEVPFAVQAMKFGAFDYLVKPIDNEKLVIAITRALERYNFRRELSLFERTQSFSDLRNPLAFNNMVAEDTKMALAKGAVAYWVKKETQPEKLGKKIKAILAKKGVAVEAPKAEEKIEAKEEKKPEESK